MIVVHYDNWKDFKKFLQSQEGEMDALRVYRHNDANDYVSCQVVSSLGVVITHRFPQAIDDGGIRKLIFMGEPVTDPQKAFEAKAKELFDKHCAKTKEDEQVIPENKWYLATKHKWFNAQFEKTVIPELKKLNFVEGEIYEDNGAQI